MLTYLRDRFRSDADTLRARAAALRASPAQAGPDADTSLAMADACDAVIALLDGLPPLDSTPHTLAALQQLIPVLEQRAAAVGDKAPVRAVYAGAATRIREVMKAEVEHGLVHPADPDALPA